MKNSIFKSTLVSFLLSASGSNSALASDSGDCKSVAECQGSQQHLGFQLNKIQANSQDSTLELMDTVRDENGNVKLMNRLDARDYCLAQGTRLPTAREFAQFSMSYGAKGIAGYKLDDSYYKIDAKDPINHTTDIFYFSYKGYPMLEGNPDKHWFWSSSATSYADTYSGYGFNSKYGSIGFGSGGMMVRCVKHQ